ncbi:hypothetical protein [Alkalibacterium sp.]|nr:MAG: hypothetical protein EA249_06565 [Alkalibacterium sp.]
MGIFDFFKGKDKERPQNQTEETSNSEQASIQYETKLTAHELKAGQDTIDQVVQTMVEEDPFKQYYKGKSLEDMTPLTSRLYKYEAITTVNVDFDSQEKNRILVVVEGTPLGYVPEEKANAIQEHQKKYLLTAFVYVTGGPYIEYNKEQEKAVEDSSPLGLDIFVQFT